VSQLANPDEGIKFVLGIARKAGRRVSEVQSVIFDKVKWGIGEAQKWLRDHGFVSGKVDKGATYWRFRQKSPRYKEYATVVPGRRNPRPQYVREVDGIEIHVTPDNVILWASDWNRLFELAEKGHPQLRIRSLGPAGYGHRDILYKPTGNPVENPAALQTRGRDWIQESYETGDPDIKARASTLRKLGYRVSVSSMGSQVTPVGTVRMTMVDIRPGTSGDQYLEDVPPAKVVRWNPAETREREARKRTNPDDSNIDIPFEAGKRWRLSGGVGPINVAYAEWYDRETADLTAGWGRTRPTPSGYGLSDWEKAFRRGAASVKRNPESSAATLVEGFTGAPAEHVTTVETEVHEHEYLATLGTLVELKVATLSGLDATIRFNKDAPYLAASEDGRQLYVEGGDQEVSLRDLKMDSPKFIKDSMVLGVLTSLVYQARKKFDNFELSDYVHKLGEESGYQPLLLYSPRSKLLSITGGVYRAESPGLID
jgi:hypothetical protein